MWGSKVIKTQCWKWNIQKTELFGMSDTPKPNPLLSTALFRDQVYLGDFKFEVFPKNFAQRVEEPKPIPENEWLIYPKINYMYFTVNQSISGVNKRSRI